MRLTLRTLLAYRDGVLPKADHESLHRRIQQSPDAANLLRRINQLVSSADPTPVGLEAEGVGSPNIIAAYLDDALAGARTAELERLCMQNSGHLSELAHCHQLLADAMTTRVAVPKHLRSLALSLVDADQPANLRAQLLSRLQQDGRSGQPSKEQSASQTKAQFVRTSDSSDSNTDVQVNIQTPMVASGGGSIKQTGLNLEGASLSKEVPEYLLGTRRSRWRLPASILALSAVLAAIVWQSLGSVADLQNLWSGQSIALGNSVSQPPATDGAASSAALQPTLPPKTDVTSKNTVQPSQENSRTPDSNSPDLKEPSVADPKSNESRLATGQPALLEKDRELLGENGNATDGNVAGNNAAGDNNPSDQDNAASDDLDLLGVKLVLDAQAALPAIVLVEPDDAQLKLLSVADPPLAKGRLMAPPATRSILEFDPWSLTLAGATIANVDISRQGTQLSITMLRGILSCKRTGQPIVIKCPSGSYEITFADESVWLGIEVARRPVDRGSILQADSYVPVLIVVASRDKLDSAAPLVQIRNIESEQTISITESGRGIAVVGIGASEMEEFALHNPPRWYSKRSIKPMDQMAAKDFLATIKVGDSVRDQLHELSADYRPEVSALAIELSLLTGDYLPLASQGLSHDRMRGQWNSMIDLARQVLASYPTSEVELQMALESQFSAETPQLLQMLAGLDRQLLAGDGLGNLVKGLDSNLLPIRVLSAYELFQLTGQENGYLPHAPVRASIQQWRQQLGSGKLKVLPVSDPVWERSARP